MAAIKLLFSVVAVLFMLVVPHAKQNLMYEVNRCNCIKRGKIEAIVHLSVACFYIWMWVPTIKLAIISENIQMYLVL